MSYPTIQLSEKTKKILIKEAIRSESEGGYGRTRAKYTKPRYQFDLDYIAISESDFETIESYFLSNQGMTFSFVYPRDSQTYTCMFNQDSIGAEYISSDKVNCKVSLISI